MPKRSVVHATFTVERIYDASPARVFEAFANLEAKSRWFKHPLEPKSAKAEMDFRVGGREQGTRELLDALGASLRNPD